jgi:hypothetical protein
MRSRSVLEDVERASHLLSNRDRHSENPTENPTDQSDTTGPIRHHRTSFHSNPDESDTTGPFRPFAATS